MAGKSTNTLAQLHKLHRLASRLRRLLDPATAAKDGLAGSCGLCGCQRYDLGENGLCRPCSMAAW